MFKMRRLHLCAAFFCFICISLNILFKNENEIHMKEKYLRCFKHEEVALLRHKR